MNRTLAVGALGAVLLLLGLVAAWRWPSTPLLEACPENRWGRTDAGVLTCGGPLPLPAAQALTLGLRLDLNRATIEDLESIPGLGHDAALALVERREQQGAFAQWVQVDNVHGIGPAKLALLRKHAEINGNDGGAW